MMYSNISDALNFYAKIVFSEISENRHRFPMFSWFEFRMIILLFFLDSVYRMNHSRSLSASDQVYSSLAALSSSIRFPKISFFIFLLLFLNLLKSIVKLFPRQQMPHRHGCSKNQHHQFSKCLKKIYSFFCFLKYGDFLFFYEFIFLS